MRVLLSLTAIALSGLAYAQTEPTSGFDALLEEIARPPETKTEEVPRAQVRVLEFANNRLTDLDLTANQAVTFRELELTLKGCRTNYNKVPGQDVAWLNITEQPEEEGLSPVRLFAGWMFNSFPDASTLDHPKYDVRLLKCLPPERLPSAAPMPAAPTIEDGLPEVTGGELSD